jgi:hypothetical protein
VIVLDYEFVGGQPGESNVLRFGAGLLSMNSLMHSRP